MFVYNYTNYIQVMQFINIKNYGVFTSLVVYYEYYLQEGNYLKKPLFALRAAFVLSTLFCVFCMTAGCGKKEEVMEGNIQATITMEDGGVITLELYPDIAPQSVRNFVYLARQGFYDGLKFHRIMNGFMIQGGDPDGDGTGGPGYSIKGEFSENGFTNDLKHTRGVISMARSGHPDSAGSQFFIMHADSPGLDGKYAAFGKVTGGMDVVDRIADTPNSGSNGAVAPENMPVIKSITIDSDVELPEPDKLNR